jgi:hypothetical protein
MQHFALCTLVCLGAQQADDKPPRLPPAEFKGEAKANLHAYKMEKGVTYRIIVRGDGFVPTVQVQGQNHGLAGNPVTFAAPGQVAAARNAARLPANVAQLIFIPSESKIYQIQVNHAFGNDIDKGPYTYALSVERAALKPQLSTSEPPLQLPEQMRRLERSKHYSIMVTGRGFAPEVQVFDGKNSVALSLNGRWFGFGPDAEFVTTLTYAAPRTADYRIVVGVGPVALQRTGSVAYSLEVAEVKVAFTHQGQLSPRDPAHPRRGGPQQVHTVKLLADKAYQIDMASRAFDCYLFLEDAGGTPLAEDDDSGGQLNARLVFRPGRTDSYRIVTTTFDAGPRAGGPYSLIVHENPHAMTDLDAPASGPAAPAPKQP